MEEADEIMKALADSYQESNVQLQSTNIKSKTRQSRWSQRCKADIKEPIKRTEGSLSNKSQR